MEKTILIAVDFSEYSRAAIQRAVALFGETAGRIDLAHVLLGMPQAPVMGHPSAREILEGLADEERRSAEKHMEELLNEIPDKIRGKAILLKGLPADEICELAVKEPYDVVVVSTHGRTGLKHVLIGSVAERIVRHAAVPILVVR